MNFLIKCGNSNILYETNTKVLAQCHFSPNILGRNQDFVKGSAWGESFFKMPWEK